MRLDPLYQSKVVCACCESSYQTSRVRPSLKRAIRSDSDFCSYFKTVNPDYYVVRVCPFCGFAATENFAERLNDRQRAEYLERMGKQWQPRDYGGERTQEDAMACYKLALLTSQTVGEKDRVIAGLLHHIAWLYRYEGNRPQELRFLQFALESYVRMYESERDMVNNARLLYLIGELNRRVGQYHESVRWFSRVIHDKNIVDASMIRASREQWTVLREEMAAGGIDLPEEMRQNGA
ncbi:DUF2225 domain-containing protein [Cohnella nanjingensis]|uniref:DUF2225 domain-containing protein n=1 Tax=Cohnella nanjingensis TaxID=1387779 RepID=A0A7X0RNQ0_9BACL|nr:DUF2225 domain-containing protein [Cohnella nanjingensis]MBB6670893.1 DUF2225 domain-containing protein [Cohnella nanjingensis]